MIRVLPILLCLPLLMGFEPARGREALDRAFHNLYGVNLLAAVEMKIEGDGSSPVSVRFAYGRKTKGGEVRTLVFTTGRDADRALLFQRPGGHDRMFVSDGSRGGVRPISTGQRGWRLFGSDFSYDDFRAHSSDEFRIEVLGTDTIGRERTRVLRLRPLDGPYTMMVAWLSTERPVILRIDYFDRKGLWKRYRADTRRIEEHFEWHVPMRDEMMDLRSGRRTLREVKNLLIDTDVPDEMFSLTQLSRGRMPSF
jgi:hypothetical protein